MRPIKVEFQAFGPYSGHESVDFEDLASRGLFLICGRTGIGKTMIIDAMTFALFGRSSGSGRDDFEAMRCTGAEFRTSTIVSFEFEHNGGYYRFQRRLDRKTKNLSESRDVSKKDEEGNWQTLFENAKKDEVNKKAEEILGLSYDQFRQVIVLPQGQFEKLLTSNSNEKEAILTTIFGVDKWKKIADCFHENALAESNELAALRQRIRSSLEDEDCETMDDLEKAIAAKTDSLTELRRTYDEAGYEDKMDELQQMLETAGKLSELKENLKRREKEEKAAADDVPRREGAVKAIMEALSAHLEKSDEIRKLREQKVICEGKREDYLSLSAAADEAEEAGKRVRAAAKAMKQASDGLEASKDLLSTARKEYEGADREHKVLMDSYLAGITGELAKDLIEGEECPVCGSVEHPKKAEITGESVSKQAVEKAKADAEARYRDMEAAAAAQEKANADFEKEKESLDDLKAELKVSEAKLDERRKNLIDGIETADSLDKMIKDLSDNIETYEEETQRLQASEKEAGQALSLAKEKARNAASERENAQKALDKALTETQGEEIKDPDEIRDLLNEIRETSGTHKTSIEILKQDVERLENKAKTLRADSEGLEEKILQAEADLAFGKKLRGDSGMGLQRYVLGIMFSSVVAEANKMLEMVHGGRYRLFRTDDKGQGNKRGLELKVHDAYSDEHEGRFVGTLSGGEKFLAALALSIGMANVARKSGIGIDALFIDEGFGTLDEDSIGDAMNILHSIQKANGLVGIISHTQILRDNIPTKLKVEGGTDGSHIITEIG